MRVLAAVLFCLLGINLAQARQVTITVLATTDQHGNLMPWDYFTGKPADRGLAKIATLIADERKKAPNALLIDCGDTIQGATLEGVYQNYVRTGKLPKGVSFTGQPLSKDPMMLAMNALRYDAMVMGNHEFNYGLKNLFKARGDAQFPWLSANTVVPAKGQYKAFAPYLIKVVDGVRVAIIGITTPAIPMWEKPETIAGFQFTEGKQAVEKALAEVRSKHQPDLVIVAAHAGLERDAKTGAPRPGELQNENMIYRIASEVEGIDAIVFGHTHSELEDVRIGKVMLTQPKNWGMSLARMEFVMESKPGGGWTNSSKNSRLLKVTKGVAADPEIERIAKPYHELAERYLNTPVARIDETETGSAARIEDTAVIDAVQQVQLHYSKADVSMTAAFNPRVVFPKGQITVRQIAALYVYDNELYAIQGSGKMLREALENAARYYNTCADVACSHGPLINSNVIGFNYDMAQGVSYDVDLTKPVGHRIQNLKFKGKPLADETPLRIAVNNYRSAGSGGYTMFKDAKVIWRSYRDIRELIIDYYTERGELPSNPDGNWRVVPEAAHRVLREETQRDTRPSNQ